VSRETTLSRDATDKGRLDALLALFVSRVAGQLREEGLAARTVVLKLRHGDFYTVTRRHTLDEPTSLDKEILVAARALFDRAFEDVIRRKKGVRLIGVAATNIVESATEDLFEPVERTRLRELTTAIDQVRKKFGFDAVATAETLPLRRQERE
jgi:DNA polymerase-4